MLNPLLPTKPRPSGTLSQRQLPGLGSAVGSLVAKCGTFSHTKSAASTNDAPICLQALCECGIFPERRGKSKGTCAVVRRSRCRLAGGGGGRWAKLWRQRLSVAGDGVIPGARSDLETSKNAKWVGGYPAITGCLPPQSVTS